MSKPIIVVAALLAACSASQSAPSEAVQGTSAEPVAVEAEPAPSPQPGEAAAADQGGEKPSAEPEGPSACPSNMKLVEGEYCSKVEHQCKRSWYDESNKKTVCEEFEPSAKCVGTKAKKRYCIDTYAWPNKKGERPEVMNRYHQAQVKCAAIGKRLCTESEWTFACEGPEMKPFPYGYVRDTSKCHGDVMWDSPDMVKVAQRDAEELARLWKGVRSGSQPECISDFGVADLPGNNDEIVASETFEAGWRGKYDSVHTGGPWYKGVRNQCRPKIYTHDEGFYYYFLGFRCCAEPDGAAVDPRTPRQIKEGWNIERVERLAGFTREDVRRMLERKAQDGHCGCPPKDVRCNTLCGTLLAPSAKDYK
jgi:hypothetical protein